MTSQPQPQLEAPLSPLSLSSLLTAPSWLRLSLTGAFSQVEGRQNSDLDWGQQ